jgi:hypothetical protein
MDSSAKTKERTSIILMLLLLNFSGNPILRFIDEEVSFVTFAAFLVFFALVRNKVIIYKSKTFFSILITFFLLFSVQFIYLSYNQWYASGGFMCKIFIAFSLLSLITNFRLIYVEVMYYISIISLIFFATYLIFPAIANYAIDIVGSNDYYYYHKSFILYTIQVGIGDDIKRNSGLFLEPGLFAGYLNIAIILLISIKEQIERKKYKKFMSLITLTLLTTFSTQGYLVFALIFFYLIYLKVFNSGFEKNSQRLVLLLSVVSLSLLFTFLYNNIEFLGNKIVKETENVVNQNYQYEITRVGGFITSLQFIAQNPFIGWGIDTVSSISQKNQNAIISTGTGMTDLVLKLGIVMFLFFMFKNFKFFRAVFQNKMEAFYFMIVFIFLIQGEPFFNYPLIFIFYLLGFSEFNKKSELMYSPT